MKMMRPPQLLIIAALLGLGLHGLFHFADWMAWGFGIRVLDPVRRALWPLFGARDGVGWASHASVELLVLMALGASLAYCRGEARASR